MEQITNNKEGNECAEEGKEVAYTRDLLKGKTSGRQFIFISVGC